MQPRVVLTVGVSPTAKVTVVRITVAVVLAAMIRLREKLLYFVIFSLTATSLGLLMPGDCRSETSQPPAATENGSSIRPLIETYRGPLGGLEQVLFDDAADGHLDRFSPFEAALIAGGVNRAEDLRHYQNLFDGLADELQKTGRLTDSARENADILLGFLHARVFHNGYSLAATDLREALDHGRYNCVSATVLYLSLARRMGLCCSGLETTGHAFCRVLLPEGPRDIETTSAGGAAAVSHRAPIASTEPGATGAASVRAKQHWQSQWHTTCENQLGGPLDVASIPDNAPLREVSPIQLAAMIYYNHGVDLLNEKHFHEAASANAKALSLDPQNRLARGNLLATINNWSVALSEKSRYAEAAKLLGRGLACDPNYTPFVRNIEHIRHKMHEQTK